MVVQEIEVMLRAGLPGAQVIIKSNDNTHFAAVIITDQFNIKKSLERQKMVFAVLGQHITNGSIHALSLKTFTQQEWQNKCVS